MKKLRNLIAVMAMFSMAAVLTGCGDDDDEDEDDDDVNIPTQFAPLTEAELTAQNRIYTANVAGQNDPITLTFPAEGQYSIAQGTSTETGTISGATRDGNTWTMNITPAAGQEGAQEGILRLDFTAENAGTFTFTPTGGQAETGTFTVTVDNGGGDGGDGGDGGGEVTTLTGRTLQINYANGGGEKFDFTTDTNVSYENGAETGTYTWDSTARRVNVSLSNGWLYEITIPAGGNTGTVSFRENSGANPQNDDITYTLSNPQ